MTEAEKLKVQIALLDDLIQVVAEEKTYHDYAGDLGRELEDHFGRRLAVLHFTLKQLSRQPNTKSQPEHITA